MRPLYTVGHSTRSLEELMALLSEHGIERLVDVRRIPSSRRHPHFGRERLAAALAKEGITYHHEAKLGGRRSPGRAPSPNSAWRQAGFRAYADHMASSVFKEALELLVAGSRRRTAVLCAEAVPWRCHRQLIADALVARGCPVVHILGPKQTRTHELHPQARILEDGTIVYPAEQLDLSD